MTPDIHRAALRAAAKLALPAFLFACGSATPSTDTNDESATTSSEADLSAASCSKKVDTYCNSMHPYETKEQCCKDEVADAHFPAKPHMGPGPDTRVDALTRGCCTVLADAATKAGTFSWPERGECCAAIGWDAAGTCTPWGPPVPPAMKKRSSARLVA
jgi:hypothetical protein